MAIRGRNSAGPRPSTKSGLPANSTAERDPRCTTPIASMDPSAGSMHGTASQWFPVSCHETLGTGKTGPGYSLSGTGPRRRRDRGCCVSIVAEDRLSCAVYPLYRRVSARRWWARRVGCLHTGLPLAPTIRTTRSSCRSTRHACPITAIILLAGLVAGSAGAVGAQAVSAIGDDALTLPGGVVRLSGALIDTRYDSRYGTGGLQPLGTELSLDSLGPAELPILAPLQSSLRALTLDPTLGVSLGSIQTTSSVLIQTAPIGLDIGISHRLTLHALVPIVHTHTEILFNPNPGGSTGNVGLNPALYLAASRAIDTALYGQFAHAAASLQSALAGCVANAARATYCPSLLAQRAGPCLA